MKNYLFRGKRIDNGEWVYGYFVNQYGANQIYLLNGTDNDGFDVRHIILETVGQYTGLTDKNGKEIFEGDILEFEYYGEHGFVEYDVETCRFEIVQRANANEIAYDFDNFRNSELEVVGNIHDNGELLEV